MLDRFYFILFFYGVGSRLRIWEFGISPDACGNTFFDETGEQLPIPGC